MITKTISTEHGDVSSTADVQYSDNGQVVLHVTSTLGAAKHEHRVTVGAEDGSDAISTLSEDALKLSLQSHLDKVRDDAAKILSGRAKVQKITSQLQ